MSKKPLKTDRAGPAEPWIQYVERLLELSFKDDLRPDSDDVTLTLSRISRGELLLQKEGSPSRLTRLSAEFCKADSPLCESCPLHFFCHFWRDRQTRLNLQGTPFIDLFCGAGGLSWGLETERFFPVFAVDNDPASCDTYHFNRPFLQDKQVSREDIEEIDNVPEAPLLVGGPPCQGFSNANRQRLSDDPRNHLYKHYIELLDRSAARLCIMENVPGVLSVKQQLERDFEDIQFLMHPHMLNAADFGYPQNRKRLFWLGVKTDDVFLFSKIHQTFDFFLTDAGTDHPPFFLSDAISDLPPLEAKTVRNATSLENDKWGYTIAAPRTCDSPYCQLISGGVHDSFLFNHRTKFLNERDREIYARLKPGEGSNSAAIRDIMPYERRAQIFLDKFYRLEPDKPSKTITAHMYYDCHMYIHPSQPRGLTPREAARIQGFPDSYFFLGLPNEWYRQIGNAVSPLIAGRIARALRAVLSKYGEEIF